MGRRVKSITEPEHGYQHREHRSKAGRDYKPDREQTLLFKRKKEKLKIADLWQA